MLSSSLRRTSAALRAAAAPRRCASSSAGVLSVCHPTLGLQDTGRELFDMAADFAEAELKPHADAWDANKEFPVDVLKQLGQLGFAGCYVSAEYGGSELSRLEGSVLFEALAAGCTSTTAYLTIHNMCAWMIDQVGTTEQKERWLPGMCSFDLFNSYCLTEPGSGSDAASLRTKAVRDGDHYVLNGAKAFISGGGTSDVYLVMCRTGDDMSHRSISCIAVEKDTPGLSFGANERKLGWNTQPTAAVMFDDCRVPVENLLGKEGEGFKLAMKGLDGGRISIASCSLGAAQACLEQAVGYTKERKQFDTRIADFQNTQFKLADMATRLQAARLMTREAAAMYDRGDPSATVSAAMAKRYATDVGFQVCDDALQLHGGYAYLRDLPVERLLRDCRVHRILEGTNEVMRVIISRALLKD